MDMFSQQKPEKIKNSFKKTLVSENWQYIGLSLAKTGRCFQIPFNRQTLISLFLLGLTPPCLALEPEPRKWGHLPLGTNILGVGYAHSDINVSVDPALLLENAEVKFRTLAGKYIRTFELFDKTARFDFKQSYREGEWTGIINGVPGAISREGLTDSVARFAINLYGGPPLKGEAYRDYRLEAKASPETIVGAGLAVRLPTGEYMKDKLINLGQNRFVFRPQLGVSHTRGKWTTELSAEVALFTDNDEYFKGQTLEQDPLYAINTHFSYTFRTGLWAGGGLSYNYGGEKRINGVDSNDTRQNVAWALNFALPISQKSSVTAKYINAQTQQDTGFDSETFALALSTRW